MLKEDIAGNTERVELYFAASYVENDHEFSAFLAVLGADYYGALLCLHLNDQKMSFLMNRKGH